MFRAKLVIDREASWGPKPGAYLEARVKTPALPRVGDFVRHPALSGKVTRVLFVWPDGDDKHVQIFIYLEEMEAHFEPGG